MITLNHRSPLYRAFKLLNFNFLLLLLFCISNFSTAQQKAFPDAVGAAAYATGGRGGEVYHVTNLNNSGLGSFRDAVSASNRTVVFDVSGTIQLTSNLHIYASNLTIAGHTAPLGGITITGKAVFFQDIDNVIVRYIRFRPDYNPAGNVDALNGVNCTNFIIDHCSISWGGDEAFSTVGSSSNITVQNCIFGESKTGMLAGDGYSPISTNYSIIGNLYYNISHRFPNVTALRTDVINNVVHNWFTRLMAVAAHNNSQLNEIGNFYQSGVKTADPRGYDFAVNWLDIGSSSQRSNIRIYTDGNVYPSFLTEAGDDWSLYVHRFNVNSGAYAGINQWDDADTDFRLSSPLPLLGEAPTLMTAQQTLINVPLNAGANKYLNSDGSAAIYRDKTDDIYITNVTNNVSEYYSYPPTNIVTKQHYLEFHNSVSNTPINSRPANYDSDNDGMPNVWENQNGLNPNNSSDANSVQPDGYTNLEYYLNEMSIVANTTPDCSNEIATFPYSEGFENTLGAWTQSSADDIDWTIDANGTPSSGTGPANASQGTYYVFVEASGNPAKQAFLNSPCFNLSNLSNANFSFKYHQLGSTDTGTIDLEASDDNGASWTSIWNSSGNLGNSWLAADIDLTAYVGGSVQLRFNRVVGNSYQADIAIDEVNLKGTANTVTTDCSNEVTSFPYTEGFENTLGGWTQSNADDIDWTIDANGTPSSGTGPTSASQGAYYVFVEASGNPAKQAFLNSPCFNLSNLSNANFSFKYHQSGSTDTGTIDLEASDDNGASWTSIWNSSGNLGDSWLDADIDLAAYLGGSVQLRFNRVVGNSYQADIAIDEINLKEIINTVDEDCSGEIASFPYTEGFENTLGGWTQSSVDDIDWTIDANGTPSSGTGPTSASQGTYYVFVEASGNPAKQAFLNSPCFNLSNLSNANFSFKYHQSGSTDTGTIDLEASDDNGASWASIWNSSGNLGNSWLTAEIDLAAYLGGSVQLRFNRVIGNSYQADIAIDEISLKEIINTVDEDCAEEIASFPYTEGFENTLGGWTQSSEDDIDWTIDANGTPSSGTGPASASQGTYYVFVEASGNPAKQAFLNSPCFNLSNLSNANFSFKYHQSGSTDSGTLDLELSKDNGTSWTSIWNSSGNLGDSWLMAEIDLTTYIGGSVQLRFNRVVGNSYQADIAIDEVSLTESTNSGCASGITSFPYTEGFENTLGGWTQSSADDIDWTIDANGTPSSGTGPANASQGSYYVFVEASGNPAKQAFLNSPCFNLSNLSNANFSFKYHQSGSTDSGTIALEASDDNGASWTSIWNSSGNLGDSWLTANIDLTAYLNGSVRLRFNRVVGNSYQADIAIDEVSLTESVNYGCANGITSFPYTEGFENTLGGWSQSSADDIDWTVDANGTPSSGTGPTSASQGSYYVFVEASANLTKQAILNSPCFNLSSLSDATFSFKYHQLGSTDSGTIDLEVSDDNGASWTSIWNSSGNIGDSWQSASVNLSSYVGGSVQLRFNRITGNTWKADIAIDDVSLSTSKSGRKAETGKSKAEAETKTVATTIETNTIAVEEIKDIALYPNPVKGSSINIKSDYANLSFEIYNMVGQIVSKGTLKNNAIDISNLNTGVYQIRFSSEGQIITKRFIKQ
ncbi:T9SS-dependent choice-of-anchor J family protein [Psychroserpens algicola]|uniref:T9SS-dependent choice-of-anchor J family protein n=1 Tax=Psychroserpens algicola TaxID=1719034 RepID=UPI0020BD615B|nr:choice-of-anchor J domain-containing protein [Psychroserpens algicola]